MGKHHDEKTMLNIDQQLPPKQIIIKFDRQKTNIDWLFPLHIINSIEWFKYHHLYLLTNTMGIDKVKQKGFVIQQ